MIGSIAFLLIQSASPASVDVIPASAKAVVDHVDALYKGDIPKALTFVSDSVENSVSDTKSNLHFPAGKTVTQAMYLSITKKGSLPLSWFDCKPEPGDIKCDMVFGSGRASRNFTMRYFADNGPITKIYSWENHDRKSQ